MKVGDLVQVRPARVGTYLVIRKILKGPRYRGEDSEKDSLWLLFGEDVGPDGGFGCAPMNEEWIEVINES